MSMSSCSVINWRWMKGKKAQEVLPILMLLGMISGFAVFGFMRLQELSENRSDPFYGSLGQRELHLMSIRSSVEAELSVMDIIATQSMRDALSEEARRMYMSDVFCVNPSGATLANHPSKQCLDDYDLKEVSDDLRQTFSRKMYDRMISSGVSIPFNHDIFFIQDGRNLVTQGYARSTLRYPIDASDFQGDAFSVSMRRSVSHAIDLSRECNYVGSQSRAREISGRDGDAFNCGGGVCTGPCPEGLQPELVPYMNQCNIPECEDGFCNIDYRNICRQGCGFKSTQMAFSFFGGHFDELSSPNTGSIQSLINDMRAQVLPGSGIEEDLEDIFDDVETTTARVTIPGDSRTTLEVADSISDEHYELIIDGLEEGLVRLQLTHEHDKFGRIPECQDNESELGYCINQHYVLAIAGDEDHIIIHDPYTPGREYKTGINVVISKNYLMDHWTGEYALIRGEA